MPFNDRPAPTALGVITLALTVMLVLAVFGVLLVRVPDGAGVGPQPLPGHRASEAFFADYVRPDGRVIRQDQGSDSVSEGQAYALRLALGDGDAALFDRVWSWTREHLQLSSGLFAWRWQDGALVDAEPVADADVDIAVALTQASSRFARDDYADEARRIASAVLDHETQEVAGRLVLVAGPWAVAEQIVNPSYLAPCDHEALAAVTNDPRWLRVRDSSAALLGEQLATGLPPDWSILDASGRLQPIAQPEDRVSPARYGLDAARVSARIWECDSGRALAPQLWNRLQPLVADGAYSAYALDGTPLDRRPHPLGLIAGALAAGSVGDGSRAEDLIDLGAKLEHAQPSYYGAAWLALAEDLLDTISIRIPTDVEGWTSAELAAGSGATPSSTSADGIAPPVWWPAPPPEQTTTIVGSLTVTASGDAPAPAGQVAPAPTPPHPTPTPPPPTNPPTTNPPTTNPPTTNPPTTNPPTTNPPTTNPPTTNPPTTNPPTTDPPTTDPPTTEPPTSTTPPGSGDSSTPPP